jgi:hypothetical protein
MATGNILYSEAVLGVDPNAVKALVEEITGSAYDVAIRQVTVDYMREIWATVFSAFACLYYMPGDIVSLTDAQIRTKSTSFAKGDDVATTTNVRERTSGRFYTGVMEADVNKVALVTGYGMPYGTSYTALDALQDPISSDNLIPLGFGMFMRFHKKIPVVTDNLALSERFNLETPYFYFAANSQTEDVSEWVLGAPTFHFSLVPTLYTTLTPLVKFTPRYAYYTSRLYINTDLFYAPSTPSEVRETTSISVVDGNWSFERYLFFLKYRHLGSYSSTTPAAPDTSQNELTDIVKKMEEQQARDRAEREKKDDEVPAKIKDMTKAMEDEITSTTNTDKLPDTGDPESL